MIIAAARRATESNPNFVKAIRQIEERVRAERLKEEAKRAQLEAESKARRFKKLNAFIRDFCAERGVSVEDVTGQMRKPDIMLVRHDAILACYEAFPHFTFAELGEAFGGRRKDSLRYAIKKARERAGG